MWAERGAINKNISEIVLPVNAFSLTTSLQVEDYGVVEGRSISTNRHKSACFNKLNGLKNQGEGNGEVFLLLFVKTSVMRDPKRKTMVCLLLRGSRENYKLEAQ